MVRLLRRIAASVVLLAILSFNLQQHAFARGAEAAVNDPYVWLEERHGEKAMQWVQSQNATTLRRLEGDARYRAFYREALAIASTDDRIPTPRVVNGRVFNLWRDSQHPHGIWRSTTPDNFKDAKPRWTTVIDLDALGSAERRNWVWHDALCLEPEQRLCLIGLSDGGEDAVTYREFDLVKGRFVAEGFELPTARQDVNWLDENTLIVSRDWGTGTLTQSGHPFVVKTWRRGQPLSSATEVFRGAESDQGSSFGVVLSDAQGHRLPLIERGTVFTGSATFRLTPRGVLPLGLPEKIEFAGMIDGHVIFRSPEDWKTADGRLIAGGTLACAEWSDLDGRRPIRPTILLEPTSRQSIKDVIVTRSRVVVSLLDEVRGRALILTPSARKWTITPVTLPEDSSIDLVASSGHDDNAWLTAMSFVDPPTLWQLDAISARADRIKVLPASFDAAGLVVEQLAAKSSDGTRIPYFIVHRKDIALDGSTPTLMTAYGGFSFPYTPAYLNATGKLWIERGGSFVLANIRGGGEFGPAWHEAGRKTRRQIVYDDFAAVARDVIARGYSSPARLGIYGRSNGGLLMGVELNQHPELWRAVVMEVPMLDLMRYEQIEAGASWVDEWGSVTVPTEKTFLESISPYLNLRKGTSYPEPFLLTTTADDRVGPQHARKFAARMQEYGLPCLFYEDLAGGHSGDADITQGARLLALKLIYFHQKLFDRNGPAKVAQSTTARHSTTLQGKRLDYDAVLESFPVAEPGRPAAAATLTTLSYIGAAGDARDANARPVLFAFGGGPGGSSLFLNVGLLGPERLDLPADVKAPAQTRYPLIRNDHSILDSADVVLIDTAETGFSRLAQPEAKRYFYSVRGDAASVTEVIEAWSQRHGRVTSPKYILGISYGAVRAVEVANDLLEWKDGSSTFQGIVLISPSVAIGDTIQSRSNIVGHAIALEMMAATSWYHKRAGVGEELTTFAEAAARFGAHEWLPALLAGSSLSTEEREHVATGLSSFTGIPAGYFLEHDLHLYKRDFRRLLLADQGLILGEDDSRYTTAAASGPSAESDLSAAMPAAAADIYRSQLGIADAAEYRRRVLIPEWRYISQPFDAFNREDYAQIDYVARLLKAMASKTDLRVLIGGGCFDTTATAGAQDFQVTRGGLDLQRLTVRRYLGGHAFFSDPSSLAQFSRDLRGFIARSH